VNDDVLIGAARFDGPAHFRTAQQLMPALHANEGFSFYLSNINQYQYSAGHQLASGWLSGDYSLPAYLAWQLISGSWTILPIDSTGVCR
jgi:hypothetical protein